MHYIVPETKIVAWALGFHSAQMGKERSRQTKCRSALWKCEKWEGVSDDVSLSEKMTNYEWINAEQVKKLIKQKENQVCEESLRNGDHQWKNRKINVKLVKGKQKFRTTLIEVKISWNTSNHEEE